MWYEEFRRLRAASDVAGIEVSKIDEGDEWSRCPWLDPVSRMCRVYAVRPLVCRLFGLVPWLPCPIGRARELEHSLIEQVIRGYAARPRKTYWQWAAEELQPNRAEES